MRSKSPNQVCGTPSKWWGAHPNHCTSHPGMILQAKPTKNTNKSMVVSGSPKVGSVAYNPPIGRKNTTYILLVVLAFVWGVICYRSHLLGEPETTIEQDPSFEVPIGIYFVPRPTSCSIHKKHPTTMSQATHEMCNKKNQQITLKLRFRP